MNILGYKLRNRRTGLYMYSWHKWSKFGKVWGRRNYMTMAIVNCKDRLAKIGWQNLEVVTLVEAESVPFQEFYDEKLTPR